MTIGSVSYHALLVYCVHPSVLSIACNLGYDAV